MSLPTGLPLFSRLANSPLRDWQVVAAILLAGAAAGSLCFAIVDVDATLPRYATYNARLAARLAPGTFLFFAAVLFAIQFWFVGALRRDVARLQQAAGLRPPVGFVAPSLRQQAVAGVVAVAAVVGLVDLAEARVLGTSPGLGFVTAFREGSARVAMWYVAIPVVAIATSATFLEYLAQARWLREVAGRIAPDLHRLDAYQTTATPMVRMIVGGGLFASVVGAGGVFMGLSIEVSFVLLGVVPVIALPLVVAFGRSVWVLRDRIRARKAQALDEIRGQVDELDPATPEGQARLAVLMTHQMFVESRWEWPVASHLQTVVFFVLLPPVTWILAASIEHLLFGQG